MMTAKDRELLVFLAKGTDAGQIRWEFTAEENQFVTALKGKYKIIVTKLGSVCYLRMTDMDDRDFLSIDSEEYDPLVDLFEQARRVAFNVDAAIDDILKQ